MILNYFNSLKEDFNLKNIFGKQLVDASTTDYIQSIFDKFKNGSLTVEALAKSTNKLDKELVSYIQTNKDATLTTEGFTKHVEETGTSLTKLSVKSKLLRVGMGALNATLTMGASLLAGIVLEGVISWFDDVIHKSEKLAEAAEKSIEKVSELKDSLKSDTQFVDDNALRFAQLSQGTDEFGGNKSLSTDEYKEFLNISNQLADIFPNLDRTYDDNGNAIIRLRGNVDDIVSSLQGLMEAERDLTNASIASELPTIFDNAYDKSKKYEEDIQELQKQRENLVKSIDVLRNLDVSQSFDSDWVTVTDLNTDMMYAVREAYKKILSEAEIAFEEIPFTMGVDENGLSVPVGFTLQVTEDVGGDTQKLIENAVVDILGKYENKVESLDVQIQNINAQHEQTWNALNQSISSWLYTNSGYKGLDDTTQDVIQQMVDGVQWSEIEFDSWYDAQEYIQNNILNVFASDVLSSQLKKRLLDSLSQGSLSDSDYIDVIQKLQADINAYFKEHGIQIEFNLDFLIANKADTEQRLQSRIRELAQTNEDKELVQQYMVSVGIDTTIEKEAFLDAASGVNTLNEAFVNYNETLSKTNEEVRELDAINESLDKIQSAYQTVSGAVKEYRENKALSLDTVQALLSLDDEYLQVLYNENGQLTLNTDAYKDLAKARIYELYTKLASETVNMVESLESEETATQELEDSIDNLIIAKKEDIENGILQAETALMNAQILGEDITSRQQLLDKIKNQYSLLNTMSDSLSYKNFWGDNDSGSGSGSQNKFKEEINWIDNSLENINREIDSINDKIGNTTNFKDRLKLYDDLDAANQKLVDATTEAANDYKDIWEDAASKIDSKYVDLITASGSDSKLTKDYEEVVKQRKSKYKGSKYAGNVDLYNRPILLDDEGYYETLKSETFYYSDFGINKQGAFNVTPILPDGTKISNLGDYILEQLENGKSLEDLDIFLGGGYSSIEEAVEVAIALHEEQDAIYGAEAELLRLLSNQDFDFSIEDFTDEETYNKVMNAMKAYKQWQSSITIQNDALAQQQQGKDQRIEDLIAQEEIKLELNALEMNEAKTANEKNALLRQENQIKANILKYNKQLAKTEEDKLKYQKEYNQGLNENAKEMYDNNQTELGNKASYYDTRIQDIQNDIDLEEAKGGQGTEAQYLEMNQYYARQKEIYEFMYDNALDARNDPNVVYGSDEWDLYNQQIQDAENNINKCTIAQLENNRAILSLPIKPLEDLNEELQIELDLQTKNREKIENAIGYASTLVQDQVDLLNKNKKAVSDYYDEQIKPLEEQKDALTANNDEMQRQIDLENAKYKLDKALNNKTSRIYRIGEGFVYEANQEDVRSAQQDLDKQIYENEVGSLDSAIDALKKQKETETETIDKQIEAWEEYASQIEKVTSSYERFVAMQDFISVFGAGAIEQVLSQDTSILTNFETTLNTVKTKEDELKDKIDANNLAIQAIQREANAYMSGSKDIVEARKKIDEIVLANQDEIEAIGARTTTTGEYSKKWTETEADIITALGGVESANITATENEKTTLEEREENLKAFKEKAIGYYNEIATAVTSAQSSLSTLQGLLDDAKTTYDDIVKYNEKINGAKSGSGSNGKGNQTYIVNGGKISTYHDGGIVGKDVGEKKLPDFLMSLAESPLKPNETLAKLLNGEVVLNNGQMHNLFNNLSKVSSPLATHAINRNTDTSMNVSIGDVNVYNPDNSDMIVNEIVKELPLKVIQKLSSK